MQFDESEVIWQRMGQPFSEWVIALPVLFALAVLFIVSCLRQEKGIGTMLLGLCLLTFAPTLVAYNPETFGWPPAQGADILTALKWGLTSAGIVVVVVGILDGSLFQKPDKMYITLIYVATAAALAGVGQLLPLMCDSVEFSQDAASFTFRYVFAGIIVGGFLVNLAREFGLPALAAWPIGVVGLGLHMAWLGLEGRITEGMAEPLPVQLAPYMVLFLIQCVLSAVLARTALGLAVIGVLAAVYIPFAVMLRPYPQISWWVILAPVLLVALFYVALMYIHDARTIHPIWACFLGLLRCGVYAILAIVFLAPGRQYFQTTEIYPKIVVLFDVSASMDHKDELALPDQEDLRLSRQQKVHNFLMTPPGKRAWMERLLEKSHVTAYRFGDRADDATILNLSKAQLPDLESTLRSFLNPRPEDVRLSDLEKKKLYLTVAEQEEEVARRKKTIERLKGGTDVAEAADQVAKLEAANYVQAFIIVSDGRSNGNFSAQPLHDFRKRVDNPDRKIEVITIGVGAYRQPVEIKVEEIQTVETIRPDEKIPLRVPVTASKKLSGEKFPITLEALRVRDNQNNSLYPTWWKRRTAPVFVLPGKTGVFQGQGEGDFAQAVEWIEGTGPVPGEVGIKYEIDLFRLFAENHIDLVMRFQGVNDPNRIDFDALKKQELGFMQRALSEAGVKMDNVKAEAVKTLFGEKFLEGEWEFTARVPKHREEVFYEADHVNRPPARVLVQNKKPRILLFAGGPTKDYQYVRTLLAREAQMKRIELSVYLQSGVQNTTKLDGVDQDVPQDRLLSHFPHRRGADDPRDKFSSINMYDVIIAFDPDWTALNANLPDQASDASKRITNADVAKLVTNWVEREAGGIIFVAGPINTFSLATPGSELAKLPSIVPVVLKDYRLYPNLHIDMKTPYPLTFTPQAQAAEFLRLEQPQLKEGETMPDSDPTVGWQKFFWGPGLRPPGPGAAPRYGFYSYYPVEGKRNDTTVLATFHGPDEMKIKNRTEEQPFLATMRFGNGKTVYVGGDTWRLRQYKESYHDSFWINLARYATSGTQSREKFGRWVVAPRAQSGVIPVEIQIKEAVNMKGESDENGELVAGDYLPKVSPFKPKIYVRKRGETKDIEVVDLKPKEGGPWLGWWECKVRLKDEGEYDLVNKVFAPKEQNPLTSETLVHTLQIFEPKREEANLREDFEALMKLASDAETLAKRVENTPNSIETLLPPRSTEGRKLFFPLDKADKIPECLLEMPPNTSRIPVGVRSLWDVGLKLSGFHLAWSVPLALFLLAGAIMLTHQKWIMGGIALFLAAGVSLGLAFGLPWLAETTRWYEFAWEDRDLDIAVVSVAVIGLLSLEWLTRKLLKLA